MKKDKERELDEFISAIAYVIAFLLMLLLCSIGVIIYLMIQI